MTTENTVVVPSSVDEGQLQNAAPSADHYVPQDTMSRVLGKEKTKAFNRGYAAALEEIKANSSEEVADIRPSRAASGPTYDKKWIEDQIDRKVEQRLETEREDEIVRTQEAFLSQEKSRLQVDLVEKAKAVASNYPDYVEVTKPLNIDTPSAFAVLRCANSMENAGDILYELGNDPSKLAILDNLAEKQDPILLQKEMKKLSRSLKKRSKSSSSSDASAAAINSPMNHVTPSHTTEVNRRGDGETPDPIQVLNEVRDNYYNFVKR